MTTVQDVLDFLQTLAPQYMKMDWDNVGLLCGRPDREVRRILVALDPFEAVCREAADWQAELLVTHHPLIFQPLPSVTELLRAGVFCFWPPGESPRSMPIRIWIARRVESTIAWPMSWAWSRWRCSIPPVRTAGAAPGACSGQDGRSRFRYRSF